MLLGQDRRRHQQCHLLPGAHRLEGGSHGEFGLAVTHISAHQAIHRFWLLHVLLDRHDRLELICSLLEGEGILEGKLCCIIRRKGKSGTLRS